MIFICQSSKDDSKSVSKQSLIHSIRSISALQRQIESKRNLHEPLTILMKLKELNETSKEA